MAPLAPPGYTYALDMFNTVSYASNDKNKFLGLLSMEAHIKKKLTAEGMKQIHLQQLLWFTMKRDSRQLLWKGTA